MGFKMLLGRTAMQDRFYVDASESYLLGNPATKPGVDYLSAEE